MTLFVGTFLDTPTDPLDGGRLRSSGALLVVDGVIRARGAAPVLRRDHPDEEVVALGPGLVLPGFVDTHVHFPQIRMIGALGMPLLDWLERSALPEEARLADVTYAGQVADEFLRALVNSGTTTALVFGSHFAPAVDVLFARAAESGLRVTSGLVVSDRILREDLLTTPQRAYDEGLALAHRWHGVGRARYAVIPRFSLSCTDALLDSCAALAGGLDQAWVTSHLNENTAEVDTVRAFFDDCPDYLTSYARHGLVTGRSVFAHNVHATAAELEVMAAAGASVAHCPTSNSALGSGLFPLRKHVRHGVRVALGSDVGAGTGFSLLKEGLQAYFMQQLLGPLGLPLTSAHLLHLATRAGACALGLDQVVGDFEVGRQFDAVRLDPHPGTALEVGLRHARDEDDAVAKAFALGTDDDVAGVWVAGRELSARRPALRRRPAG
jgi:guanine deaminase